MTYKILHGLVDINFDDHTISDYNENGGFIINDGAVDDFNIWNVAISNTKWVPYKVCFRKSTVINVSVCDNGDVGLQFGLNWRSMEDNWKVTDLRLVTLLLHGFDGNNGTVLSVDTGVDATIVIKNSTITNHKILYPTIVRLNGTGKTCFLSLQNAQIINNSVLGWPIWCLFWSFLR